MIYFDSSALVKLFIAEAESAALRGCLAQVADQRRGTGTSTLARVEVMRALAREDLATRDRAARFLASGIGQVPMTDHVLDAAAALPGAGLRSLDAIHLATALQWGAKLTAFVTYDKRLADAAVSHHLTVRMPGAGVP